MSNRSTPLPPLVEALARISSRKMLPKPKPPKRRMAKQRKRRRKVTVQSRKAAAKARGSEALVRKAAPPEEAVPPAPFIDRGPELPYRYNSDKLVVMVRDPNWLYSYWDFSDGLRDRTLERAPGAAWVLRVHNLTDGNHEDIPVLFDGGNWYLPVVSDTEYMVEMGLLDAQGNFHLAASSRAVKTPPVGLSDRVDEEWMVLETELARLMDLSGALSERFAGSHFLSEIISRRREAASMHLAGVGSFSTAGRK